MLEELVPGLSGFIALSVVTTVTLSEVTNRLFSNIKMKNGKTLMSGIRVLVPLLFAILFGFIGFWSKDCALAEVPQRIVTIFGYSVMLYEIIVKRVFPKEESKDGTNNEDQSNLN